MTEPVLGILGGMGPAATVDLYGRITSAVLAGTDQEHPRILIDSNAKIPDRTAALVGDGPDPTPALLASARTLRDAGVDVIVMPCNTAHAYLDAIRDAVDVPVLDMIDLAATAAGRANPVGLLATAGTVAAGLYPRAFGSHGIEVLLPDPDGQSTATRAIDLVKAGDVEAAVPFATEAGQALIDRGAGALVLGCTEFSVLTRTHPLPFDVIDPMDALAAAALDHLGIPHRASRRVL